MSTQDFVVQWCHDCDFYYQQLVAEDKDLSEIYASHGGIEDIIRDISAQKVHWLAHMTEEILVMRQMLEKPFPKVLDYGCNWGKWASMALAYGCDVYAVEVNRVAAEFCRSRGIKVLECTEVDQHQFDFINVDQVLEHVSDPRELARELAKCVAPKGYMKWSVPGNNELPRRMKEAQQSRDLSVLNSRDLDALEPFVHINLFTNKALRRLAARSGLEAVRLPFFKWLGAGQMWNVPRQIGRNLYVPRKRWLRLGTYLWFAHV